jgi:nucleotide-binding universal stress UspA family protein
VNAATERIVVGIDGSPGARAALIWALREAASRRAAVEVVSACPVDFLWTDAYLPEARRLEAVRSDTEALARALLEDVRQDPSVEALAGAAALDIEVSVVVGAPAPELVERSDGAALLVVGSRGRGAVRSAVAGSVALHCAAHARCPVVVVHPTPAPTDEPARVVVGLDSSEHARAALAAAAARAVRDGAVVDAVVAYESPHYWSDLYAVMAPPTGETEEQARERGLAIAAETLGPGSVPRKAVRVRAVEGHPAQVLVREADGAGLLVVGSRSRNPLEGLLLGSVALACVLHAPCPVLVVRPQPEDGTPEEGRTRSTPASVGG